MTAPLVRGRRALDSRFRALEQKLNGELGYRDQRLRFKLLPERQGPTIWLLRNTHFEQTGIVTPTGTVAELAPAAGDGSILFFGYNEQWEPAHANLLQFASSNLRFAIRGVADDVPDLRFRLEWAGATAQAGVTAYPGRGAAHPHWQFDVDEGWIPSGTGSAEVIDVSLETEVDVIDLSGDGGIDVAPKSALSATLTGFHRLHLPARAMWHQILCEMPDAAAPQQHTPGSQDEIDRWLVSALRYLRHEFASYL